MAILSEEGDGEELVHEDAAVLRVVAEPDDVPVAVIGFELMGLGASSHFPNMPDGGERHSCSNLDL